MLQRLGIAALALCSFVSAHVVELQLSERSDVLDGKSFGAAGPYERMVGKALFAVDPKLPANRMISDIALAPVNENGEVEFSADIYVLKPRDPAKGNHAVIFEVSNRGGKGMLATFNRAVSSTDPRTQPQLGDNLLLEQGYTIVWLGWQWDVPKTPGLMRLYAPAASDHGRTITGLVRSEFIPESRTPVMPLADRAHTAYPVVDMRGLTVRDSVIGERKAVAKSDWQVRNGSEIYMEGGFTPGKIYEAVYTSKDPVLTGLGPAAVRDLISFLKYNGVSRDSALGDQYRHIKQVYGFGISQSGRFLRKFLYDGFNADENGRKVFDGMMIHVAGAGMGSFNHRFAQPSRDGHAFMNVLYPTDVFPFTDLPETDPETGVTDGLLARATAAKVVPKIFYSNSAYEYWGRDESLTHTTPDGRRDAEIPPTSRIYFFAGGQHSPSAFPPRANNTQNPANPNDYRWALRALLLDLDSWVKTDTQPPDSVYPKIADGTLVPPAAVRFPGIAKVPAHPKLAYRMDFGPEFEKQRIATREPPEVGRPFTPLVPQVDADGNDLGGIRMPEVAAPLATYTGWNFRAPSIGSPDEVFAMVGSFFPLPLTPTAGDPRKAVGARYSGKADYVKDVSAAANALVSKRLLLQRDVAPLVNHSAVMWDFLETKSR